MDYKDATKLASEGAKLNPYHTHQILVDTASVYTKSTPVFGQEQVSPYPSKWGGGLPHPCPTLLPQSASGSLYVSSHLPLPSFPLSRYHTGHHPESHTTNPPSNEDSIAAILLDHPTETSFTTMWLRPLPSPPPHQPSTFSLQLSRRAR